MLQEKASALFNNLQEDGFSVNSNKLSENGFETIVAYRKTSDPSIDDQHVVLEFPKPRSDSARIMDLVEQLMIAKNIPLHKREEFEHGIALLAEDPAVTQAADRLAATLPDLPVRDIRPYEGIVSYIKAPDGLGPWYNAGQLNRPLIGKLSRRAYVALANWLRDPRHSLEAEGITLPSETISIDSRLEAVRNEILATLPSEPPRDIRAYEGIVSYIKAADGLGQWHEAGVLTRPLIGKLSPRAYTSLANWLKDSRHSLEAEGINLSGHLTFAEASPASESLRNGNALDR